MKKIFILAIILLSGTATASAQEFLTINPDVRTAGMANASVATTGGAYSVFQNAASSLFSHNLFEVGFSYSPWMRDVKKGYDLMAFGGFYSFNHKHSISFGTRFYREPKLSPDDEDYPFIPKDENNNPIVGIEAFRPLSVSADLAYSYRIGRLTPSSAVPMWWPSALPPPPAASSRSRFSRLEKLFPARA